MHPDVRPQNARKGEFSRANVKGKRALELGAGPGLGGLAFALLGADVLLTDLPAVTPLTRKNVDANLSAAALQGKLLLFTYDQRLQAQRAGHDSLPGCERKGRRLGLASRAHQRAGPGLGQR